MMKTVLRAAALLAFLALSGCADASSGSAEAPACVAGAVHPESEAGLAQVQLCIVSKTKTHSFVVELAQTGEQQQKGLMFRTELADNRGMLFPFREPHMASFWMRNTVIPLDIIFVRADGSIENIVENTTPYSLDQVKSTAPVAAVLELRSGLTTELGIKPGDKVRWK